MHGSNTVGCLIFMGFYIGMKHDRHFELFLDLALPPYQIFAQEPGNPSQKSWHFQVNFRQLDEALFSLLAALPSSESDIPLAVFVSLGPGSFALTRFSATIASALHLLGRANIYGIPTLDMLAVAGAGQQANSKMTTLWVGIASGKQAAVLGEYRFVSGQWLPSVTKRISNVTFASLLRTEPPQLLITDLDLHPLEVPSSLPFLSIESITLPRRIDAMRCLSIGHAPLLLKDIVPIYPLASSFWGIAS